MDQKSNELNLIFLGSSGSIMIPAFHCSCKICEEARINPKLRRTRASIAIIGKETTIIDVPPEIEFQLERESIRDVDNIFITHWHGDHMWGIESFWEPASHGIWNKKKKDLFISKLSEKNFELFSFNLTKEVFNINPVLPGDVIELSDASIEVVKTNHTEDSIGFIITTPRKKVAYLVQGIEPPKETLIKLKNLDILILDATLDDLKLKNNNWRDFTIKDAIKFWRSIGTPKCILSHLSCHKFIVDTLIAGITHEERIRIEQDNPGLKFAYDGMKLNI